MCESRTIYSPGLQPEYKEFCIWNGAVSLFPWNQGDLPMFGEELFVLSHFSTKASLKVHWVWDDGAFITRIKTRDADNTSLSGRSLILESSRQRLKYTTRKCRNFYMHVYFYISTFIFLSVSLLLCYIGSVSFCPLWLVKMYHSRLERLRGTYIFIRESISFYSNYENILLEEGQEMLDNWL